MTWVVGASTIFGYGLIVSDICVTFRKMDGSKETRDCLQKIYPIAPSIVAGFSGSVRIGFELIDDLQRFLPPLEKGMAWQPEWVAENWKERAQKLFDGFPQIEKDATASIIMVGLHPTKHIGIPEMARIYVVTMNSWEGFVPKITTAPSESQSIGSGSIVGEYRTAVRELVQDFHPMMQMEVGNLGGWGKSIAIDISAAIRKRPTIGVSEHLHIGIVTRDRLIVNNNDCVEYPESGEKIHHIGGRGFITIDVEKALQRAKLPEAERPSPQKVELKMPSVAQNYPEFLKMAKDFGLATAEASASLQKIPDSVPIGLKGRS